MEGKGLYSFIPCPGFVGTIFVNSISNIFSTMANNCEVTIEAINGAYVEQVLGGYSFEDRVVRCGDLKFGQSKDIVLKMKFP